MQILEVRIYHLVNQSTVSSLNRNKFSDFLYKDLLQLDVDNEKTMIIATLLLFTVSGTTAIPQGLSLGPNGTVNNIESESKGLNRTRRDNKWMTISGDQYSFTYHLDDDSKWYLGTVFSFPTRYYYNKFHITRDLGYTSWDKFLADYKWADFNERMHIQFSRADKIIQTYDVRIMPETINLSKILTNYQDVEQNYGQEPNLYVHTGMTGVKKADVMEYQYVPFDTYHQKIFDESIWSGATRVSATVLVTLEGFKKDNELILQLIFRLTHSNLLSASGIEFKLQGYNQLVLK